MPRSVLVSEETLSNLSEGASCSNRERQMAELASSANSARALVWCYFIIWILPLSEQHRDGSMVIKPGVCHAGRLQHCPSASGRLLVAGALRSSGGSRIPRVSNLHWGKELAGFHANSLQSENAIVCLIIYKGLLPD